VKITLARPYEGHPADATIDVPDEIGASLIRHGRARQPDPKPKKPRPVDLTPADPELAAEG
jgi:hypothetical protein